MFPVYLCLPARNHNAIAVGSEQYPAEPRSQAAAVHLSCSRVGKAELGQLVGLGDRYNKVCGAKEAMVRAGQAARRVWRSHIRVVINHRANH